LARPRALGSTSNDPVTGVIDLPEISAPATAWSNIGVSMPRSGNRKTNVYIRAMMA
jgi:hypothetical protein